MDGSGILRVDDPGDWCGSCTGFQFLPGTGESPDPAAFCEVKGYAEGSAEPIGKNGANTALSNKVDLDMLYDMSFFNAVFL